MTNFGYNHYLTSFRSPKWLPIMFACLIKSIVVHGSTVNRPVVVQLQVNQDANLLPKESLDHTNGSTVNYFSSWLISDNVRCTVELETDYSSLDFNHSISQLIVWYQVNDSKYQLFLDSNQYGELFSREYFIDLPLVNEDKFRLLIDFQSSKPFNYTPQLIKTLDTTRCWNTYQACPVLSCTTQRFRSQASCSFSPELSFNCSTSGLCIHLDEVCDYEINCPDASDEANCDQSSVVLFKNDDLPIVFDLNRSIINLNSSTNNLRCSFEVDYCSWKPIKLSNESCFWEPCFHDKGLVRTIAAKSLTEGPTFDHTRSDPEGHYLLLRSTRKRGPNTGSIVSLTPINGNCKLIFHYLTNSRTGQVLVRSSDNSTSFNPFSTIEVIDLEREKSLFTRVEVEIDLGLPGEWLFLVAMIMGDENSFLAIDDIYFTKGCSPTSSSPPNPLPLPLSESSSPSTFSTPSSFPSSPSPLSSSSP